MNKRFDVGITSQRSIYFVQVRYICNRHTKIIRVIVWWHTASHLYLAICVYELGYWPQIWTVSGRTQPTLTVMTIKLNGKGYGVTVSIEYICNVSWKINSLWPSDTIWRHTSGSTWVQVMACCLTAPSHYLNQCWLIISKIQWHSSECNFTWDASAISHLN